MEAVSAVNVTQDDLRLLPPPHVNPGNFSYHDYDPSAGADPTVSPTLVLGEGVTFPEDPIKLLSVQVVLILAYSTIIVLGVLGNSLVIYVIYRFKTLRTVTNFFIANLAVADLLVNTLCLPFTLVYTLQGEWKFGSTLCFLLPYAQGLAVHVSTVTLNVIALDRHRCIVYHLETRMRKDVCFGVIALTWVLSAVLASPLAIFREYGSFSLEPGHTIQVCTEKWPGKNTDGTIYSISMLILQYFLPLSIISFAYARIWSKLRGHVSPAENVGSNAGSERHRRRRKTTKMLVTMVVVFAVSWLPFHAFQLATDIDSKVLDMRDYRLLYTVFHVVAMCSTFANPLLYGWMNRNYRAAFLAVFKCRRAGDRGGRLDSIHPVGGRGGGGGGGGGKGGRAKKIVLENQDVVTTHLNATDV
uniref:neuropeptide Y receptor Y2, like n=1 Tax=Scatophagus argus TaxID=75038 RepID=UPI001ED7F480|nr:neuropeptide Y receptor Y2, like [Scatophagus argus]XP_046236104.1 neuropeptide Y receptor Y2, like [Scatophagus argus]XP_046236105.1 neuropeptide Y receptor Y2, like [Scatophagus argus]XP_046236106.1 neuropeptide Y receptor Y2, like [Scatophagus argus]